MSYLIDTNVISETFRENPNNQVINWFKAVPSDSLFISVINLGEIRKGVEKLPTSKKKSMLILCLEHQLPKWFDKRVLPITSEIADRWGYLCAHSKQTLPAIDGLLAATALVHNLKIVTRNVKDFEIEGLEIINPFD